MARWAVMFSDKPEMAALRAARGEAHLEFLRARRDRILFAGALRDEPGGAFLGGLWIVEAQSRDEIMAMLADDPFYDPQLRSVSIAHWGRAFPEPVTL